MKIGLETESYHLHFQNGRMDIFDFIRRTAELGLDGVQINIIKDKNLDPEWGTLGSDDPEHLLKVRKEIEKYGLYVEIDARGTEPKKFKKIIKAAHILGADVIRTYVSCGGNLEEEMARAPKDIEEILPLLKKYRIKLAIENHEYETAEEMIELVKKINNPWIGITCDIGNGMMVWEEPIDTVKKLAPYTLTTHFKDYIIVKEDEGDFRVCGIAIGDGNIDTDECFKILVENTTLQRINIEMCHPYTATFKKEKGAGGVFELGKGAFKVENPPAPADIKPSQYYYPPEEHLEDMIKYQDEEVRKSAKYMLALRDKYCK